LQETLNGLLPTAALLPWCERSHGASCIAAGCRLGCCAAAINACITGLFLIPLFSLICTGAFMITLHTNYGDIVLTLDFEKAPKTAANFKQYAEQGFYDGTIFHRVINNFMIQGGGMTADMSQKKTQAPIENEADNGLKNELGTVAMARTSDPHSATAQFFINVKNNEFLNHTAKNGQGWGYCVFGKVTAGMDVVDKIRVVKTGNNGHHQDVPVEPVIIERVSLA
jgi:peptidyl-prolyl cis-trans isomerase B (cyclophilin B)